MWIVISGTALLLLLVCLYCQGCMEEEREALQQIKSSINSPKGTAFSNWYGADCCQWEDVDCDASTSRVVRISFRHQRDQSLLQNWYPNATIIAQFNELQELYLPGNQIGGFISPNALHKLKYLRKLDLHDNSIEDASALCWYRSPSLYFLDLSSNKLKGYIPKCLSNMTSLQHLDLSNNQLSGSFPSLLIRNLTNIESLIISQNRLKGLIYFSIFANLSKLTHLDISYNDYLEVETETPTWFPTFNLNGLKLGGCNLNKQSGNKIPSFISTQHHLQSLDLSYNSLVGSIPSWLIFNVTTELWMRGNNLSGSFPRSYRHMSSQLVTLAISDNFLYGPLPEDINLILPDIHRINASMNIFNGSLPSCFGEMKQLQNLDLSRNDLHGEIPYGMISNMTSLEYLELSDNYLRGEVLPRNSSLPNLRYLYLDRNSFTSISPYGNFSSLLILSARNNDLSGKLSSQLPALTSLRVLLLGRNHFEGGIPLKLCHMKQLFLLDLSINELSGCIPSCLDNITSWKESPSSELDIYTSTTTVHKGFLYPRRSVLSFISVVDVSSNKLTGRIPIEMGELINIHYLNVSNNLLTGEIPVSFRNLTDIEALDLSHNKLAGLLPPELSDLTFLAVFDVSFNNLSGNIPQGKQFATFDNSSYAGNPNLCGFPVSKICAEDTEKPSYFRNSAPIWLPHTPGFVFGCVVFLLYLD